MEDASCEGWRRDKVVDVEVGRARARVRVDGDFATRKTAQRTLERCMVILLLILEE